MAFGDAIPPFSFPQSNSGIEIEVIREALAYHGHTLTPEYFPLARVPFAFKMKAVDAAMTDLGQDMLPHGAYYGDPAVVYDNVFISLSERQLTIDTPADLEGLSVISFQGADMRYPNWLEPVQAAHHYFEQPNQLLQVLTLQRKRFDVVLCDINIFRYFSLQLQRQSGTQLQPTKIHHFTELDPMHYRPVFRDAAIRDDFNQGLAHLKASGRYQAIYDKYLQPVAQ